MCVCVFCEGGGMGRFGRWLFCSGLRVCRWHGRVGCGGGRGGSRRGIWVRSSATAPLFPIEKKKHTYLFFAVFQVLTLQRCFFPLLFLGVVVFWC